VSRLHFKRGVTVNSTTPTI